jgi:hypothetical protein
MEYPKKDLRLPFSLVTFFWSMQKKVTYQFGRAKNEQETFVSRQRK